MKTMTTKRLLLEFALAMALAWFAASVGEAYADQGRPVTPMASSHCQRGLPALPRTDISDQTENVAVGQACPIGAGAIPNLLLPTGTMTRK